RFEGSWRAERPILFLFKLQTLCEGLKRINPLDHKGRRVVAGILESGDHVELASVGSRGAFGPLEGNDGIDGSGEGRAPATALADNAATFPVMAQDDDGKPGGRGTLQRFERDQHVARGVLALARELGPPGEGIDDEDEAARLSAELYGALDDL